LSGCVDLKLPTSFFNCRFSYIIGFVVFLLFSQFSTCFAGELIQLKSRPQAPDFELADIGGKIHLLSDYRGEVVLVNFWATWCVPCRAEMPSLERLNRNFKGTKLEILAVNWGESKRKVANFYFETDPPMSYKMLLDPDKSASQFWPMQGLPMTFLVDREGHVSYISSGGRHWDTAEVAKIIRQLQNG
jgi:thiol-disulfide isomerase/thioredoxin